MDESKFESDQLPKCKSCEDSILRPNIVLFGDYDFNPSVIEKQEKKYEQFVRDLKYFKH